MSHARHAAGRLSVVVGASGGCGASLVGGALALVWARGGDATWLVELDPDRGDLAAAWDAAPSRTLADLVSVADELVARHVRQAAHEHPSGVLAVAAAPAPGCGEDWTAARADALAGAAMAAAGPGGRVVVDAGTGLRARAAAVAGRAADTLVVCDPTLSSCRRARRIVEALAAPGGRAGRCGLVVGRRPGRGEIGTRALGRAVGAEVLAELPWSEREAAAIGAGRWPRGRRRGLARALEGLAEALA